MKQLIQPNLAVKGAVGFCLVYARMVFGIGPLYPTAWNAWERAIQHEDRNFPPLAVPVWFKHPAAGTIPGHVAIRLPSGDIYSSPFRKSDDRAVLSSIAEVERLYNAKYVGWSEDINNVRVADVSPKGEIMVPDDSDIINFKRSETGVPDYQPTGAELEHYKAPENGFKKLGYDMRAGMQAQIDALKQQQPPVSPPTNTKAEALLKAVQEAVKE